VLLPPVTMAAMAHHSRGLVGLASALARASLERAADNGISTVSVEMVDEIASLYGSPAEPSETRPRYPTARAFGLGAIAALVVLALVVAAAEVRLLGSGGRRIRADVEALSSLAGFGQVIKHSEPDSANAAEGDPSTSVVAAKSAATTGPHIDEATALTILAGGTPVQKTPPMSVRDAQLKSPREVFLGERKSGTDGPTEPYSVQIKPPQRPVTELSPPLAPAPPAREAASAPPSRPASGSWAETHVEGPTSSGETLITVPGVPGPLAPSASKTAPPILKSPEPASTPPATDTATARNSTPPSELGSGPHVALQVGAFRERESAEALKGKLAREFEDVYVSTVDSGGEPLFRVRVGKFRSPEDAAPMRERLQASGYASFRVDEP
jgi:cell division protein FtsN